jgi:hypothetical protein
MNPIKQIATLTYVAMFLLAGVGMADDSSAKQEVSQLQTAIASKSILAVVQSLPELESLWTTNPEEYLRTCEQVMGVLEGGGKDATARAALFGIYDQVLHKKCPDDIKTATVCYQLMKQLALRFFAYKEVTEDRGRLLAFAKFIGEARTRVILGYRNRGTNIPGREILDAAGVWGPEQLENPTQIAAYRRAVEQNEQDLLMNRFQLEVSSVASLTTALTVFCGRFSSESPEDTEFRNQVAVAAHLSEVERQKLKTGRW